MEDKRQERIRVLEDQIARLQRRIALWLPQSNRYSWLRVGIFFVGLAISVVGFIGVGWWLGLSLFAAAMIVFAVLAHFQGKLDHSIARHTLWSYIQSAHLARMKLDWEHIPHVELPSTREEHPFEFDLDITGSRSLLRLVNTSVSQEGSQRLERWLLNTHPDLATVQRRQALVQELTPLSLFRDKLLLKSLIAAGKGKEQLEGKRLLNWLNKQGPAPALRWLLWLSLGINLLTVVLFVLGLVVPGFPQLGYYSIAASVLFFFSTGNQRGDIFEDATYLRFGFATLSSIFTFLERYPYGRHQQLKALCAPFWEDKANSPSSLLSKTARISSAATLKNNGLLWLVVNAFIPWDMYCAYRLNQYKEQIAQRLPTWLDTWYEIEATCSLATFAYLHPGYVMPEVHSSGERSRQSQTIFSGTDMGHPLIPVEKKVTNSFTFSALGEVVILTGSNMAGKSTFLRTLGVNLCLAYAGAPVNASTFETELFRLFTCIRVTDSVNDGYSYFYAEVRRLRALLTALAEPDQLPLFFMVDEIFKGTNNRERLIGSRSFVRALVGKNCIGLISTHDLELVKLAEILPQVKNYHFREHVTAGQLVFDYILRTGPCPTTNALKIMEIEGLPIDDVLV
ncbi:MutS family DNA mismatch repair protein [Tengunoibacter tsumagoiensis]|nr:MutS family DNA mismatch repair protein [Tengunoibacter tsumagoiensis]